MACDLAWAVIRAHGEVIESWDDPLADAARLFARAGLPPPTANERISGRSRMPCEGDGCAVPCFSGAEYECSGVCRVVAEIIAARRVLTEGEALALYETASRYAARAHAVAKGWLPPGARVATAPREPRE